MSVAAALDEAMARLEAGALDERRRFMAEKYAPTALQHLGCPMPVVHAVARSLSRGEPSLELVEELVATGVVEGRMVAYDLCWAWRKQLPFTAEQVEALGVGNDNWPCADLYAAIVSGPMWMLGVLDDEQILGWARRDDPWWRRMAATSTVAWNKKRRGGTGDTRRTLMLCHELAADRDPFVVKAVSWALRELVPWDPEAVRGFLETHEVAARVRREATKKLTTGRKNG